MESVTKVAFEIDLERCHFDNDQKCYGPHTKGMAANALIGIILRIINIIFEI